MLIFIDDFIQNHDRLFINNSLNIFISSSAVSPERDLNVKFCERTYIQLQISILSFGKIRTVLKLLLIIFRY